MTMKTKKIVLWYAVFVLALILNQTKSFADNITVKVVVHALWVMLGAVTYVYFKEGDWE